MREVQAFITEAIQFLQRAQVLASQVAPLGSATQHRLRSTLENARVATHNAFVRIPEPGVR